jgi:thiamine monophosphate synthase
MKKIAITPDGKCNCAVNQVIVKLLEKEVTHIYLRTSFFIEPVETIIKLFKKNNIVPIVPVSIVKKNKITDVIVHFKEQDARKTLINRKTVKEPVPFSVSCHTALFAEDMIKTGAAFVFVSPVFKPLSKNDDSRVCFPLEKIRYLVKLYGEKIILLGGITNSKEEYLKKNIEGEFGIAGITEFFAEIDCK